MLLSHYVIAIFLNFKGNRIFVVLLYRPWAHTKQRNDWYNWYVLLQNGAARITEITTMNLWSSVMRHFVSGKWSICRCFKEKDCLHFQGWSEPIRNRPVKKYLPTSRAAPSVRTVLHKWRSLNVGRRVLARWMSRGWSQMEAGFLWRCVTVVVSFVTVFTCSLSTALGRAGQLNAHQSHVTRKDSSEGPIDVYIYGNVWGDRMN